MNLAKTPAQRLRQMYHRLLDAYGPQHWWPAATPFEVILGAYLTQNTSWRGVERSILQLAGADALHIAAIREMQEEQLRYLIRPSGYMLRKAAAIKAFVAFLDREYAGSLENLAAESIILARPKLLALPGVGPETADAILLYALAQPAMVVDEYLRRVTTRHELLPSNAKYAQIQALAVQSLKSEPPETLVPHYNEFHALIVVVGKTHCGPTPKCEACPLRHFLPQPVIRLLVNTVSPAQ
jgi:endonuclease-3 related protein